MKEKKIRVSTILIVLLVIIVIALLIFLGVLLIKFLGNKTSKNTVGNNISNSIENVVVVNQTNNINNQGNAIEEKPTVPSDYVFKLDSRKKYKITTDARILTYKEDGSYTDIYYQIDLENNIMTVVTEQHPSKSAADQSTKKDKVSKVINESFQSEIKTVINRVINRADARGGDETSYYRLESLNREKKLYNKDNINDLITLFQKFKEKE